MKHWTILAAALTVTLTSCSVPSEKASGTGTTAASGSPGRNPREDGAQKPPSFPHIKPSHSFQGRVVQVFPKLRFVIIDFSIQQFPEPGQRLFLYRGGLKTAELKVTGPTRDTITAADILSGSARVGDQVREE